MSLRRKLLEIKANWEKWEDRLAIAAEGLFSSVCVIPYAAFISAYSGLSQEAWLYYLLLFAQALAASGLSRRLRRRQKKQKQAPQ